MSNQFDELAAMLDAMMNEGGAVVDSATEEVVAVAETVAEKTRGRKHTFGANMDNIPAIVAALQNFDEAKPSLYHVRQLVNAGYVEISKGVQVHDRGRKPFIYSISEKAKELIQSFVSGVSEETQQEQEA